MDEEIDLRGYLLAIGRRWKLVIAILAVSLVGGVAAYFIWPWEYAASATVAVTHPRYVFDLESQWRANMAPVGLPLGLQTSNDYFLLGRTDDMIGKVIKVLGDRLDQDKRSVTELRRVTQLNGDAGALQFACTTGSAEQAALIANTWASIYVERMNDLFGKGTNRATVLSTELAASQKAMREAEAALADFTARNPIPYLEAQLTVAKDAMTQHLSLASRLKMIEGDAGSLRARLASQDPRMPTLGSQLHSLFLEATAFGPEVSLPMQLQLPLSTEVSSMTASQLAEYMDDFIASLQQRGADLLAQAAEKAQEVGRLEQQLDGLGNQLRLLRDARDIARQTQSSLVTKIEENRVTQAIQEPEVRLMSPATVPAEPKRPEFAILILSTLAGGLFVAALAALAAEYLRSPQA